MFSLPYDSATVDPELHELVEDFAQTLVALGRDYLTARVMEPRETAVEELRDIALTATVTVHTAFPRIEELRALLGDTMSIDAAFNVMRTVTESCILFASEEADDRELAWDQDSFNGAANNIPGIQPWIEYGQELNESPVD